MIWLFFWLTDLIRCLDSCLNSNFFLHSKIDQKLQQTLTMKMIINIKFVKEKGIFIESIITFLVSSYKDVCLSSSHPVHRDWVSSNKKQQSPHLQQQKKKKNIMLKQCQMIFAWSFCQVSALLSGNIKQKVGTRTVEIVCLRE